MSAGVPEPRQAQRKTTAFGWNGSPVTSWLPVAVGTLSVPTTTGNQDVTGLPFQPKAVIFRCACLGSGTPADTDVYLACFGAATSSSQQWSIGIAENGAASSNAGRRAVTNACITLLANGTPAVDAIATFVQFNADGFRVNWTDAAASAGMVVEFTALGGADLTNVFAGSHTIVRNTAGTEATTGVGFTPDFLMFASEGVPGAAVVDAILSVGFARRTPTVQQNAMFLFENDAAGTMDAAVYRSTTKCIGLPDATAVLEAEAQMSSFDASGFTLNWTNPVTTASSRVFYYLALKGGQYATGSDTSPTTTGNRSVTVGFEPRGVLLTWINRALSAGGISTASGDAGFGIGGVDNGLRQGFAAVNQTDGNAASQSWRAQGTTRAIRMLKGIRTAKATRAQAQADSGAFTSTAFQLNWTTVDAAAYEYHYAVFGNTAAVAYSLDAQPGTYTVTGSDASLVIPGIAVKQEAVGSGAANTVPLDLDNPPTAGNLIVICQATDKTAGGTSFTVSVAGFTTEVARSNTSVSLFVAWKVSDGTEGASYTTTVTDDGTGSSAWIAELEDAAVSGSNWEVVTKTNPTYSDTAVNSRSSGTTGSLASKGFAVAPFGIDSFQSVTGGHSFTNAYTAEAAPDPLTAGGAGALYVGTKQVPASATTETTFDYTGTADQTDGVVVVFNKLATGGAFSLNAAAGTYAVSGVAASPVAARIIDAAPAAYTFTGTAATPVAGRTVNAAPGAYTVTGTAASLIATRLLNAEAGIYTITGTAATAVAGRVVSADPGAYLLTGIAADLVHETVGDFVINADPAVYTVTGTTAGLITTRFIVASPADYTITGAAATTAAGRIIVASPGSYALTGVAATLAATRMINAAPGVYLITGTAAETLAVRILNAEPGAYNLTGILAELVYSGAIVPTVPAALVVVDAVGNTAAIVDATGPSVAVQDTTGASVGIVDAVP